MEFFHRVQKIDIGSATRVSVLYRWTSSPSVAGGDPQTPRCLPRVLSISGAAMVFWYSRQQEPTRLMGDVEVW